MLLIAGQSIAQNVEHLNADQQRIGTCSSSLGNQLRHLVQCKSCDVSSVAILGVRVGP